MGYLAKLSGTPSGSLSVAAYLNAPTYLTGAMRRDSRQIEEMRTGDFSSVKRELASVFEHDPPPIVPVNLLDRWAKETAELYVRRPHRTITGVRAAQSAALLALFRVIRLDSFMATASEQSVAHSAVVVSVDVGKLPGRPLLQTWLPHQLKIEFIDPTRAAGPIWSADRVEIAVPVQVDQTTDTAKVLYGTRVYTQTEAYLETPDGEKFPLIGDSIKHGLGRIPLVGMRRASPRSGLWLPPLPYDALCCAVAVAMGLSDMHHIARYQIHTEEHWIGQEAGKAASDQPTGAAFVHAIEVDSPADLEHEVVQRNPPLEKYESLIRLTLELFASNRSVSRTTLSESSGITGDAKAEERADQERERQRMETQCSDFEQELLLLLVDVMATTGEPAWAVPMSPALSIDYHYVQPRGNALQAMQADAIKLSQDRTSKAELVSMDEGVDLVEAKRRVAERRAIRLAEAPVEKVDGIDRTARNA